MTLENLLAIRQLQAHSAEPIQLRKLLDAASATSPTTRGILYPMQP